MVAERIQEIIDFARTESPYRSANKGWITNDIFLGWGSSKQKASSGLDKLVGISFFWEPIIQLILLTFLIFFLASALAFTTVGLSNGKLSKINEISQLIPQVTKIEKTIDSVKSADESLIKKSDSVKSADQSLIEKSDSVKSADESSVKTSNSVKTSKDSFVKPSDSTKRQKMITASDLFQSKRK